MKKLAVILFLLKPVYCLAQYPVFDWLDSRWDSQLGVVYDMVSDDQGNLIAIVEFPSTPMASVNKYSAHGELLWTYPIYTDYYLRSKAVRICANGNIAAAFDLQINPSSGNLEEGLIMVFSSQGALVDSSSIISAYSLKDMDVDALGNYYLIGDIQGTHENYADTSFSVTGPQLLVTKLDENLDPVWVRVGGNGLPTQQSYLQNPSILAESNGDITIIGHINVNASTPVVFGEYSYTNPTCFVRLKLNSDGDIIDQQAYTGTNSVYDNVIIRAIAMDSAGFLYAGGYVAGEVNFDGTLLQSNGDQDMVLFKFDQSGELVWVKTLGGNSSEFAFGICLMDEQVIIGGYTGSLPSSMNPYQVIIDGTQHGVYDRWFIAGLMQSNGSFEWIKGSSPNDLGSLYPSAFASDNDQSIYLGGYFTLENDSLVMDENILTSLFTQEGIVGKLSFYDAKLEGKIYRDYNLNHSQQTQEPLVDHEIVELTDLNGDSKYKTTTIDGRYWFYVDSGTYQITYTPPQNWQETAGISDYNLVAITDTVIDTLDFAIAYSDTVVDMSVELTSTFRNNAFEFGVFANVLNMGTHLTEYQTSASISLPSNITSITQSTSMVDIGEISTDYILVDYNSGSSYANVDIQTLSQLGSDIDLTNNSDSATWSCCPLDPNDKTLDKGECEANYVVKGDTLKYLIRFMNTGTAPAENVVLIDTIDYSTLDLQTFRVIGYSHDMDWDISGPGKLTVTYSDIQLPDSSVSFLESQGFFKYEIVLRDTVSNFKHTGQPAYIYFDYEEAVITNTPTIIAVDSIPVSNLTATDAICNGQFGEIGAELSFNLNIDSATWGTGATGLPLPYNTEDTYSVELVDEFGCHYLDSIEVSCQLVTAATNEAKEVRIIPNPSKGHFRITSYSPILGYEVRNAIGQIILSNNILIGLTATIDLSDYNNGVYLIELKTDKGIISKKLVVQ